MGELAPAIKAETKRVAVCTAAGVAVMLIAFLILHKAVPEKVPFDYRVVLGGLGGGTVAVLNFFLMALTVQKVVSTQDEDLARGRMKASYSRRMLMQMAWVVVAIVAPCFHFVAGIVPLLFPSLGIKLTGIFGRKNKGGDRS